MGIFSTSGWFCIPPSHKVKTHCQEKLVQTFQGFRRHSMILKRTAISMARIRRIHQMIKSEGFFFLFLISILGSTELVIERIEFTIHGSHDLRQIRRQSRVLCHSKLVARHACTVLCQKSNLLITLCCRFGLLSEKIDGCYISSSANSTKKRDHVVTMVL